jgi:hypothetical protein
MGLVVSRCGTPGNGVGMPFQINVVSFGIHEGAENIGNQDVSPQSCMSGAHAIVEAGCLIPKRLKVLPLEVAWTIHGRTLI